MRLNIMKLITGMVAFCLLLTTTPITSATAASDPTLSVSDSEAERGSAVSVVILIDNNPGIWSMVFDVRYDHDALTLTGYTAGSIFTADEIVPPPSLDRESFLFSASRAGLTDTSVNGILVTLTFTVRAQAAYKDHMITLEMSEGNTINVNSEDVDFTTSAGKVEVVDCIHKNSTWKTINASTCVKAGREDLICDKCGDVLDTRTIPATGHSYTKKAVSDTTGRSAATTTQKATFYFTCAYCGDISDTLFFEAGEVVVYTFISGPDSEWTHGSEDGLQFAADGDFEKFTGVKVDGIMIGEDDYDAGSGSTVVSLSKNYLATLEAGEHQITLIFSDGEISADFYIAETVVSENSSEAVSDPASSIVSADPQPTDKERNNTAIYIIVVIVLLLGSAGVFAYIKKKV